MRRACKLAEFRTYLVTSRFSLYNYNYSYGGITKPSSPVRFICQDTTQTPSGNGKGTNFGELVSLFSDKLSYNSADTAARIYLKEKVARLRKEIEAHQEDVEEIERILEENGVDLFRTYSDGSAIVELLRQLHRSPSVAMEVFGWRRKQLDYASPMTVEEYAKGITIAGVSENLDIAVELFKEACNKQLKGTALFDALMNVYMRSGMNIKCQSVFHDLKRDPTCAPSIISYNILILSYSRLMLVDHMEATFKELIHLNLEPNVHTYKGLIIGYITAWRWDDMEKTYMAMRDGHVKPDLEIHLLMLRGYALACKLGKMEEIYEMVRDHVDVKEIYMIRIMIYAYCKSSDPCRVEKVEELLSKIPKDEYQAWMNVVLIDFYAKAELLEQMQNSIDEAFEHKIYVATAGVMRCISANYFRHDAVEKLEDFVQRAEIAGWKLCTSPYHCMMVMYAKQRRIGEMERVVHDMRRRNMQLSATTYWILYKTYKLLGERGKLEQVIGMMCKNGHKMDQGARIIPEQE